MVADKSLKQRWVEILSENLLINGVAIVLAVVAFFILEAVGTPFLALMADVVIIGRFIPQTYEQYWPSTRSRGFRVEWTVAMALLTMAVTLGVYEALPPFTSHQSAGLVAAVLTPVAPYAIAMGVGHR